MGLIFRPTTRGAASAIDHARQMANKYAGKKGVWYSIAGGYILRALGFGTPNVTVQVIDTPAVVSCFGWRKFGAGGWPLPHAAMTPNRDVFLPALPGSETPELSDGLYPITPDALPALKVFIETLRFSSPPPTPAATGWNLRLIVAGSTSNTWVSTMHMGFYSPLLNPIKDSRLFIQLMSGSSTVGTHDPRLNPPEEGGTTPGIAQQQVFAIYDGFLRGLFNRDLRFWAVPTLTGALSIKPTQHGSPATAHPGRLGVAYGIREDIGYKDYTGILWIELQPPATALPLPDEGDAYNLPLASATIRIVRDMGIADLVPTDTPSNTNTTNVTSGLGVVYGAEGDPRMLFTTYCKQVDYVDEDGLTVEYERHAVYAIEMVQPSRAHIVLFSTVYAETPHEAAHFGIPYKPAITFISSFTQCNAVVVPSEGEPPELVSYLPYNVYTARVEDDPLPGEAYSARDYPYVYPAETEFKLLRSDGAHITTGLRAAGLCVADGAYWYESAWGGAGSAGSVAVDIGSNRLAVPVVEHAVSIHSIKLAILDAVTGAFIETRSTVVTLPPVTRPYFGLLKPTATISCVTPEEWSEDETIVKNSVLMVSVHEQTNLTDEEGLHRHYISTDSGFTWRLLIDGLPGQAVYLGNKLQPAVIGREL